MSPKRKRMKENKLRKTRFKLKKKMVELKMIKRELSCVAQQKKKEAKA